VTSLNLVNQTATSSGLTTSTTAYTDGDTLGAVMSWNLTNDKGIITNAVLTDVGDVVGPVDLFLFDRSVTFGTDNSAPSISDADTLFCLGVIQFPYPADLGGARIATVDSLSIGYDANASTTIYGGMVTRSGHTFFGAATNIQIRLIASGDV
jgi:hypothetical protein